MYQKEEAEEDRPAARSGGGGHADTSLHALAAADSSTAGLGVEVLRLRRALEACRLQNEDLKAEVTRLQQENRRLVRLWRNAPPAATTLARPHDPTRRLYDACAHGGVDELKAVITELGSPVRVVEALVLTCGESERREGALHLVASRGSAEMLSAILQPCLRKARRNLEVVINLADSTGWTPLHCAAANGHLEACRVLLECKADASLVTVSGATPMHYLIQHGPQEASPKQYDQIVRMMVANGANVNAQNNNAETPLHLAALALNLSAAHALLKSKARTDLRNQRARETCLHYAARSGSEAVVQLLLKEGAVKDLVGEFGTAADVSRYNRHYALLPLLDDCNIKALNQLPDDVLLLIFKFLGKAELARLYLTCSHFHALIRTDHRMPGQDHLLRIVVAGARGSGAFGEFDDLPSLRNDEPTKVVTWIDNLRVRTTFVDASKEVSSAFQTTTSSFYRGVQAALIVFDLTDPSAVHKIRFVSEALDSLSTLEAHDVMTLVPPKELDRYILDECPRIIVGNKVDLLRERAILTEDVQRLRDDYNVPYYEVSARTGENVKAAFNQIQEAALRSVQERRRAAVLTLETEKKRRKGFSLFRFDWT